MESYKAKRDTLKKNEMNPLEGKFKQKKFRPPNVLVILDDIVDSGVINFGGDVDKIAERGRHVNMSIIIASQRITAISRSIRLNSDYFIIFKPAALTETERFLEEYISQNNRKEFRDELTLIFKKPYTFIMVDAASPQHGLKYSDATALMKGKYKNMKI